MQRLIVPLLCCGVLAALHQFWPIFVHLVGLPEHAAWQTRVQTGIGLLFWIAAAVAANRAVQVLVWKGWFERRTGIPVPKLLTDVTGLLIWLAAIVASLALVIEVDVTGLVATSGLTIAVIGFALRSMIADVFTGIALGIERPIHTGDWIQLADGTIGCVTEINWRATRLVTKDELTKIVPNSHLASVPFTNFHTPNQFFRDKFQIVLGYDITAHQAERIMLSAVSQIPESTRIPRKPEVRIIEYLEHGLKWELRYWVPDYPSMSTIRYQVQRNVLRNLHYAGVTVAREKLEFLDLAYLSEKREQLSEEIAFLRSIELFNTLTEQELMALSGKMKNRLFVAGTPVVTQGQTTDMSLFIVKEGFLDVTIADDRGGTVPVGWLAPGMFFGEMSLLTGAPRSANVTPSVDAKLLEITRDDVAPLLQSREDIVRQLSEALADRQMRNDAAAKAASADAVRDQRQRLTERLFTSIVSFFGLKRSEPPKMPVASPT